MYTQAMDTMAREAVATAPAARHALDALSFATERVDWIAERLGLPMLYVRKQPKGFGRDAQIEGALAEGARVLLVEDSIVRSTTMRAS